MHGQKNIKLYHIYNCLHEDEPTSFETCRRHHKLNVNLQNCAFSWFVLYMKMHGAENIKCLRYVRPSVCLCVCHFVRLYHCAFHRNDLRGN